MDLMEKEIKMPRLTLISGKSRKSIYMEKLASTSKKSVFVLYGIDIQVNAEDLAISVYKRSERSRSDLFELEGELMEMMAQILQTEYRDVYLYGNLEIHEVNTLLKVAVKLDGQLSIIASIQNNDAPDGQIIIQEIQ
jgi:hypothetical protein